MNMKTFRPLKLGIVLPAMVAVAIATTTLRGESKTVVIEHLCEDTAWPVPAVECGDNNYRRQRYPLTDFSLIDLVSEVFDEPEEVEYLDQRISVKEDQLTIANEGKIYYQVQEVRSDQTSTLYRIILEIVK